MQLKRCTGAIWPGHLNADYQHDLAISKESTMEKYFDDLCLMLDTNKSFTGGALALERGDRNGDLHVQYYLEHKPLRTKTLARGLMLGVEFAIGKVKHSAEGSYNYCAGLGEYQDKEAVKRHVFGEVKLYGSSEAKMEFGQLVEAVMGGSTLTQIMRAHPKAYAWHRRKIKDFWYDWNYGAMQDIAMAPSNRSQ